MKTNTTYYKKFHTFQKQYVHQHLNALHMRILLPTLTDKSILDVGCGSGIDIQFFISIGAKEVSGIDISDELLKIAKNKNYGADIRKGDFEKISWKNNCFDVVWSKYALQHSKDIAKPLKEIYRVLKKGCFAYIQVTHPFRSSEFLSTKDYFDNKKEIKYPIGNGEYITENHHTISSWVNAIKNTGFTIEYCEEILNRPKSSYKKPISPSAIIFVLKK